jgi:tripartite-type tricarboxylate transporter receptor subunit TctC
VSTQGDWLENGEINILLQLASQSVPGLEDVPLVTDFAETDQQRQVLGLVLSRLQIARPFVAPPGMPEDRADALQQAFMDTLNDPELIAEVERLELEVNPMHGDDVAALIDEIYQTPETVIEMTRQLLAVSE